MKHLNFLSSLGSQSGSHRVVTKAVTVGSPSVHRRGNLLKPLFLCRSGEFVGNRRSVLYTNACRWLKQQLRWEL